TTGPFGASLALRAGKNLLVSRNNPGSMLQVVGSTGSATVSNTGGTDSVVDRDSTTSSALCLGLSVGASGTYSLSGTGSFTVSSAYIGGSPSSAGGTGSLVISGGSSQFNSIKVWNTPGSSVALSGGSVEVRSIDLSGNPSRFVWTGGLL